MATHAPILQFQRVPRPGMDPVHMPYASQRLSKSSRGTRGEPRTPLPHGLHTARRKQFILGVITNATKRSRRAQVMPTLRMLPMASALSTDPARRRCRTRPWPAGRPPPRLQKAPCRTDLPSMATDRLAASLRLGSIPASAERSAARTAALGPAADEGSTSTTAK